MIRYALVCDHDHDFEGWFRDSATCDDQLAGGAVECPFCGTHAVQKALMAPSVVSSRAKEARGPDPVSGDPPVQGGGSSVPTGETPPSQDGGAAPEPPSGSGEPTTPNLPVTGGARPVTVASGPEGKQALAQLAQAVAKLRAHVENTCEDVGRNFAEEARKIHHGETEERPIHGEATLEEAKELNEEGIGVALLPWSRRVQN